MVCPKIKQNIIKHFKHYSSKHKRIRFLMIKLLNQLYNLKKQGLLDLINKYLMIRLKSKHKRHG